MADTPNTPTPNEAKPPLTPPAITPEPTSTKEKKEKTEREYTVIYDGSITRSGIEYRQGSKIELSEEEAKNLLLRNAITLS